ncbi:glycosyltransferase family 4 protein [Neorhodopirellula lusitana]|uniref:glycosyltransferase family 4 protein n=1 Tax=Neorhodopirellula lusitana TaxID=445327 RepID=UPI00384D35D3
MTESNPSRQKSVVEGVDRHITAVSGGVTVPSSRYRVDAVLTEMHARGWQTKSLHGYGHLDRKITNRLLRKAYRTACRANRARVTASLNVDHPVLVQRLAIPTWSGPELKLASKSHGIVFDFDDAVFLDPKQQECRRRRHALNNVFRASRHVVAGNAWLADHVPSGCDVSVIPTCLNTDEYLPKPSNKSFESSSVRIGWIGTTSNFRHLEQLIAPMEKLRRQFPKVEFAVCSDVKDTRLLSQLGATFVPWSARTELATLQSFDIGIMPLTDEDWCRGKCSFKLIQYLAVGIPSVSSPVGMNSDVVEDGVSGLFAHDGDWFSPLANLVECGESRRKIGEIARQVAVARFSIQRAADSYIQLLRALQ